MAHRIKQTILSGQEAAGGYNYILAEVDAAADFAALTAFQDGSVGYIKGDQESLYVKVAGTWSKLNKSLADNDRLLIDGISPYDVLAANVLFPRRAELEAVSGVADAAALDIIALEADVAQLASTAASIHQYIVKWDKVNSQCTRMGDAADITTTITNFKHSGSVNASYDNPFDSLYPWKYRKLCKVNRAAYAALTPGSPITDAVTMWEGEPGFALDGSGDFDGVYTPEFWGRIWEDATYVYAGVADGAIPGWQHFEATIGGRYFGSLDGDAKMTSIAGGIAWRGATLAAMHANATAQELTLDDIFTWSADTLLMAVEYATLNSQTALGAGCSALYRGMYKIGAAASAGATVLKLENATAAFCVAGTVLDLGTGDGSVNIGWTRFISSADLEAGDPLFATHKAVTVTPIPQNVTTDTYCGPHGCYNAPDTDIMSMSGYIGTAGKCNAYYRGRLAHGNYWRYVLGAYRQTGTGKIWVANSRAEAAVGDTLDTGVHRDTGLVLPTEAGEYIATLHLDALLPLAPFVKTVGGGTSDNPVGDSAFTPTLATASTNLLGGAGVYDGSVCGRFAAGWTQVAGDSGWGVGALPFLKTP